MLGFLLNIPIAQFLRQTAVSSDSGIGILYGVASSSAGVWPLRYSGSFLCMGSSSRVYFITKRSVQCQSLMAMGFALTSQWSSLLLTVRCSDDYCSCVVNSGFALASVP